MQTKISCKRGRPCNFFKDEVLMNKPRQQEHQNELQGVRDSIVPLKPGNAGGGKGIRFIRSGTGHSPVDTEPIEGYHSSLEDGWGVVLEYIPDANGYITFRSLGKDQKPGGTGDDSDMIGVYLSKQPTGHWSHEFVEWKQDPFYLIEKQQGVK